MEIKINESVSSEHFKTLTFTCCESDEVMSRAVFCERYSRYHGSYIKTVTAGGISTQPEYRRGGYVRQMFAKAFTMAPERGWAVSMLHPFSFGYYRKFGYERVSDHLVMGFPIAKLEYLPRVNELVRLQGSERVPDVVTIYEKFAENRHIMFERWDGSRFPLDPKLSEKSTYIRYHGNEPVGYITLGVEKVFMYNHSANVNLNIYEMAYVSPDALRDLLGFVRMFEGENETVLVHNAAMMPELDLMLRHYTHTSYKTVPDIMARILDTETMLKANKYPKENGHFTIAVDDDQPLCKGVYAVEYADGKCEVTRRADSCDGYVGKYDFKCNAPALTQLLYGYYSMTPAILPYVDGVTECGDTADFCRAFPKVYGGLFEHF